MAIYLAMRISFGKLNYKEIFSIPIFKQFKDGVDKILIDTGHQDLISPIS